MTIRMDGIKHRFDANEGIFFSRQLEDIEAKVYEYKQRELKYRELIPVSNRDNPGANSITYRMFDKVGMAKIISDGGYADDLPRADVFGTEHTARVRTIGTSFGYSTQEIRSAQMAGESLDTMKAAASRRAVREKENSIAWNGDTNFNLGGFLTNSNIPTAVAATKAAGGTTWAVATPDEIITDIRNGISTIRSQSSLIHAADTLLLPITQYDLIAGRPRSIHSDVTVLEFVKKQVSAYGLKDIQPLAVELDLAFTGATDGAVYYEKDPEILEQRIPLELQLLPVQERNLEFVINGESRNGGVVVRYPLGCFFQYGI